jgi:hypothetical protein
MLLPRQALYEMHFVEGSGTDAGKRRGVLAAPAGRPLRGAVEVRQLISIRERMTHWDVPRSCSLMSLSN